jgi:hypothetical protein
VFHVLIALGKQEYCMVIVLTKEEEEEEEEDNFDNT